MWAATRILPSPAACLEANGESLALFVCRFLDGDKKKAQERCAWLPCLIQSYTQRTPNLCFPSADSFSGVQGGL